MLLQLLQLLDNLRPHRLRDNRKHRITELAQPDPHHQQITAVVPGIDQRLQPTRRDHARVDIDLGVRVDKGLITFAIAVVTPSTK